MTVNDITINNYSLHIHLSKNYPDRPTIVFLHDSLGCIQLWRDFPEKLAEATQCNLLMYDRLGYGESDPMLTPDRGNDYLEKEAGVLNKLLNTLNIDDAILFGHSDGGSIALITAAKYPDKVKAVISEAGHLFAEEITISGIKEAIQQYKTTNLKERLEKYHGNKVDFLFRAWTETWTNPEFRKWNIEHFLAAIQCPVLVIQGEADEYGSIEQVQKTINGVSGKAQKHILQGIGHTPHKEAPEDTLQAAKDFIGSL